MPLPSVIVVSSASAHVMAAVRRYAAPGASFEAPGEATLAHAHVLVPGRVPVTRDVLEAGPRLMLVQHQGRGVERTDIAAASELGILVANVRTETNRPVAEHALALMLIFAKRLHPWQDLIRQGLTGQDAVTRDLRGATLGVVGAGVTGRSMMQLGAALGMQLVYTSMRSDAGLDARRVELEELLRVSDFVSLHLSLTENTRGIVGERELAGMKEGAVLVNTARAHLVDQAALWRALREGRIGGAAFDVFWEEPVPPEHPMLTMPRFFLSPHLAGFSAASIDQRARAIADNIAMLGRQEIPRFVVNPDVARSRQYAERMHRAGGA